MSENPTQSQQQAMSDPGLRFFIGVRTAARPDWQRFFAEPVAPERYGAAAATKFVNEKRQKQEEMSGRVPFSAFITDAVVLNGNGDEELRVSCGETHDASVRLIEFITGSRRTNVSYLSALPATDDVQVRWFGFDIRDVMAMACLECMRYNATAPSNEAKVKVPAGIWYYRHFSPAPFIDPYETLVPSSMRDHVDAFSLCEFLGIPVPPTLGDDPAAKAELARQLALRGQFWPVEPQHM
jgi:hypothetical protein